MSKKIEHENVTVTSHGAHVLKVDTDLGQLLYLSSEALFDDKSPIRGGVPVIAPWFSNTLGATSHGWARTSEWNLNKDASGIHASMTHEELVLGLDVSAHHNTLTMRLTAENTGDESRRFQFGFHPYFKVSDVLSVRVEGLAGEKGWDKTTESHITIPEAIEFDGSLFDAVIPATPTVTIVDSDRRILISSDGADSTVVWNPGEKKADAMDDIGPREWRDFVCVEPFMLGSDQRGVLLSPGEINALEMNVWVEKN